MAGYREFQTGEVLTAANVDDFLMKQAVQKYADAAARDAALGTAVAGGNALREGMVAYLDDTDELLKYDGTAWATIGAAGIGSNVVQTVKTNTFTTTSASYVDVTDFDVTITPTSATSRILLVASIACSINPGAPATGRINISGGNLGPFDPVILANSTFSGFEYAYRWTISPETIHILDAPGTTSATTYKIQVKVDGGNTFYVNTRASGGTGASTLTAIEVAA